MCDRCWDLDRREFALKRKDCDGNLKPFMTVNELKSKLYDKWVETKQTSHVVIRDAIINPPSDHLDWVLDHPGKKEIKLSVELV